MACIRKWVPALLALSLLLAAGAGCGASKEEDMTLLEAGGLAFAIPTRYQDQLTVDLAPAEAEVPLYGRALLSVSQRAAGEEETWIFDIRELDQAGFERYVQGDNSGSRIFALDSERYYVYSRNLENVKSVKLLKR